MGVLSRFEMAQATGDISLVDRDAERRLQAKVAVKRAMMERVGFAEVARISSDPDPDKARLELRPAVEAALNVVEDVNPSEREKTELIAEILDDVIGLGPL